MEDREFEEAEALEQAELRKRLEESVEEEKAHRSGEGRRESEHGPEPEWKAPDELRTRTRGRVFLRFFIFLLLVAGVWFLVQAGSHLFFQPEVEALAPVVPEGRHMPNVPVSLGVRMANTSRYDGAGFVVAALASGKEVQGPGIPIPAHDTVLVPVNVTLPAGDHVLSLVAFSSGREARRLETFRGLTLWVGDREIEVEEVTLPDRLQPSDTVTVEALATNPGDSTEMVVPVLVFTPPEGTPVEVDGPVTELSPGQGDTLQVTIVAGALQPGRYSVRLLARTPEGVRLAQGRPRPVEVGR